MGVIDPGRADLPIIFSMARLDKVKNLTGLAGGWVTLQQISEVVSGETRSETSQALQVVGCKRMDSGPPSDKCYMHSWPPSLMMHGTHMPLAAGMYASSPKLQDQCNLVIVGGVLDPSHTTDRCACAAGSPPP